MTTSQIEAARNEAQEAADYPTVAETRHEFRLYYADLKEAGKHEGYVPYIQVEWSKFLEAKVEFGELPAMATTWKL